MSQPVDELRAQLRERGYLSHGIERWFALDPWSSRAFWAELATVALKAATLLALFGALPMVAVMLFRNHPLSALETLELTSLYFAGRLAGAFLFMVVLALILKVRPEVVIDTPRALLGISFVAAALLAVPIAVWWYRFDAPPSIGELATGLALIVFFFVMATLVVSAALLSFSIYELHRVPAIHQRPRGAAMTIAAAVLLALLFIPAYASQERPAPPPIQVVTTPTTARVALIAVDGLTNDIFRSRPALNALFATAIAARDLPAESTTERWASVGTGVPTELHGVRAIEGVRFQGGTHVLQSVSRVDFMLHGVAEAVGLARRQPLPPTVRRRDYVWELFAARGLPSAAVNWWTTDSQEAIFTAARGDALRVDQLAAKRVLAAIDADQPRFVTAYLPALEVILNRLDLQPAARLASSVRALDGVEATVTAIRGKGYEVLLAGNGVLAYTGRLESRPSVSLFDVAPTALALMGFPPSREMPGRALTQELPRIDSYGVRATAAPPTKVNEEYYQNLRSLGYIR
ncbi:MAG TPA: hypothetical protein VGR02_05230 [Thermoanaerobaculia bacterium]|nr:hypothetical protein [Thermoanaerobaculia bacterium]